MIGIAVASFVSLLALWLVGLILLGVCLVWVGKAGRVYIMLGLCLASFSLGIWWYGQAQISEPNHVKQYNDTEKVEIIGKISGIDERSDKTNLEIKVEKISGEGMEEEGVQGKILVSTLKYPQYNLEDELKISGKLLTPAEFADFSYKDYLAKDDVYSVVYYANVELIEEGNSNTAWRIISDFKGLLKKSLQRNLSEPESGFAQRLLLGERKAMSDQVLESFKKTGTMHIVAISGYHVTIVAALLLVIARPMGRRPAFVFAISMIVFYVFLTGASASVIRAAIMGILVLVAMQFGRISSIRNAIVLAAVIMLLINPKLLRFDIGFQLSFLAVIGIVYLSPFVEKIFSKLPSVLAFRDSVIITLSAMITTLPLSVYYFGRLAIISPLINFVLLPSIPLSMGLSFLTSVAGLLSDKLGQIIGWPTWLSLKYSIAVVEWGSEIPFAYLDVEKISWEWLVISYGLLIAIFLYSSACVKFTIT